MTAVLTLFHGGEQDYAIRIDGLHTVDVGPVMIARPTHWTRDGQAMEVRWKPDLGFLVAVESTPQVGPMFPEGTAEVTS